MTPIDVQPILLQLQAGKAVIVTDDPDRENEADLICAAEYITPALMAFFIRYSSGIVCVPMLPAQAERLELSRLVSRHPSKYNTPFAMPIDYLPSSNGGVSAGERAATIQALLDPQVNPADFGRPGHVFPLIADPRGLGFRAGHTEAAIHLLTMAQLQPIAVIAELMNDDGTMMRGRELAMFAVAQKLPIISITELQHTV